MAQYHHYLQSILKLLFPSPAGHGTHGRHNAHYEAGALWANQHSFLNVSITPVEVSIVCSKELASQIFAPDPSEVSRIGTPDAGHATISTEDFVVISVEGEGLEAGQRVLELTSPLALAGMYVIGKALNFLSRS